MREIILDIESTGLEPQLGHKIIEIGCVEMINRVKTNNHFHRYINPERDVPKEAFAIHGIASEFLLDKPLFAEIAEEFRDFVKDDILVIHNAAFDVKFLNHELKILKLPLIKMDRVIDTLFLARKKFPGAQASLDALCKRFNICLNKRDKHGALLDAGLLAEVYLELTGGSQGSLAFSSNTIKNTQTMQSENKKLLEPRRYEPTAIELEKHEQFLKLIKNPLWEDN
jgi:DNA polymerase-3 subunit epsilon